MSEIPTSHHIPSAMTTGDRAADPSPGGGLQGKLGVLGLVFTVLAFNAPLAIMAGFVPLVIGYGNGLGAPLTFVSIGTLLLLFSVGLTTMSKFMKSPGAFYCYIAAGIGRAPGLGGALVAFAAYMSIAAGSYTYGGILVNSLVSDVLGGPSMSWSVYALLLWLVASTLSLFNIDLSAKVLGVAMVAEVAMVLIWDAAVMIDGGPNGRVTEPFTGTAFTSGSLSFALLFGVLCVTGFEAVAVFREETKDPERTIPRATYTAVGFLAVLYALGAWVYIIAYGPDQAVDTAAEDPSGSFTASVTDYVGVAASDIVSVLLVSSAFAAVLATQNIASRYLYSLGTDRVLPRRLGRVHPTHGSPHIAAATVSVLSFAMVGTPALIGIEPVALYAALTGFGGFCLLLLMTVTSIAVVAYFRKDHTHTANAFRSIIAPVLSFLGLATVLVLAATNMATVMGGSETVGNLAVLAALALAAAGIALGLYYRRRNPNVYVRIGRQDV